MSKKSTAKKSTYNDANELLYDPYPNYLSEHFPPDIPWPEWNDSELNSEKWDEGKSKPATKSTGKTESLLLPAFFEDPNPPILENVTEWKRPVNFFSHDTKLTLYEPENIEFELSIPSDLTSGRIFKNFLELLPILQFFALKEKFAVECETPFYFPNTQGESWRPWHHIYALCKAGKNQSHKPLYCPYGKYVVRLYYMGAWRKFIVDDKIPCDEAGHCMLPLTQCPGELWPIVLAKAILKIPDVEEIPLLTFFTGWVSCRIRMLSKTRDEIWECLRILLPEFVWEEEEVEKSLDIIKPCFTIANLRGLMFEDGALVGVTMTRDKPLIKVEPREPTAPWKRFRWIYWAMKKGIWSDELSIPPYRCLLLISYLEKLHEELCIDPELESRLYDIPEREEVESLGPELWGDFTKITKYLSDVFPFYKPSSFLFKIKATYIKKIDRGKQLLNDFYYLTPSLTLTRNEPTYLYGESLTDIVIYVSLSVCALEKMNFEKSYHASLIIERYDWRTLNQQELIGAAQAKGNEILELRLSPGRHVMRLWLDTDAPFVVQFYSNINLTIFKGSKIRFLMSNESEMILKFINEVSENLMILMQSFGKEEWSLSLMEFYRSFKIFGNFDDFIDAFLNCLVMILRSLVSDEELRIMIGALRCLFINLKICENKKFEESSDDINAIEEEIRSAITIQRIFRGYRVRLLFQKQSPDGKEFKIYSEKLKKISEIILSPNKREIEVGKLIREVVQQNPDIRFEFHDDIPNVLQLDEFTGRTNTLEPRSWVLFARFTFACHSDTPIPCAFFFSCNLKHCTVAVIDNDTKQELFKLTSSVAPFYYTRNEKGYTILAFGWNDTEAKVSNWRLEMVRMKHFPIIHPCNVLMDAPCTPYNPLNLQIYELRNYYIPNRRNMICRCLIRIKKRALITVRLSLSQDGVYINSKITLGKRTSYSDLDLGFEEFKPEEPTIIQGESPNSVIMFPALVLEYEEPQVLSDDKSCIYTFEAVVRHGSWPLTPQEWGVIEPMRTNCESSSFSPNPVMGSRKRSTRMSKRNLKALESPNWCLQVYSDDNLILEEDRSRPEALKAMKAHWEENDPGRRANGMKLMEEFLKGIHEGSEEDFKSLVRQMRSFSYLLKDTSVERTLVSPRVLPKTPFEELLSQYGRQTGEGKLTRQISIESVIERAYYNIVSYSDMLGDIDESRIDELKKAKKRRVILDEHLEKERKISSELMEEAYEARLKIIQRIVKNKSFNR